MNVEQILQWLDGKKSILLGIAGLIVGYLVTSGVIDGQLGTLILAILNVIGGGAVIATDKVLGKRNNFGQRVK